MSATIERPPVPPPTASPFEEPENPLQRLTPEQLEQLGSELDALHEEVYADLGERDARYIRSTIRFHRQLVIAARLLLLRSDKRPRGWPAQPRCRWRRSSRTWRSGTT